VLAGHSASISSQFFANDRSFVAAPAGRESRGDVIAGPLQPFWHKLEDTDSLPFRQCPSLAFCDTQSIA
jgi:hypothetical protein